MANNTSSAKTSAATSSTSVFAAALAGSGAQIIVGKNSDGTNKTMTQQQWQQAWFKMPTAERQAYVNRWAAAGVKTDVINGVNVWIDYGKNAMTYATYGGNITPFQLMKQDAAKASGTVASVAFTSKDAETLVKEAYVGLLGRDPNAKELASGIGMAMGTSKSTGQAGRQQSIVDTIKSTREYDTRMENKYLDAMYNAISSKIQMASD